MRSVVYDILSLCLTLGSLVFLYRAVEFLAQKDYVAGVLSFAIGFVVIRAGVELGKVALAGRDDLQ